MRKTFYSRHSLGTFLLFHFLKQLSSDYSPWTKRALSSVFVNNKVLLGPRHYISLQIAYGCCGATKTEQSNCNKDQMAHKAWNICPVIYRNSLLIPDVEKCWAQSRHLTGFQDLFKICLKSYWKTLLVLSFYRHIFFLMTYQSYFGRITF